MRTAAGAAAPFGRVGGVVFAKAALRLRGLDVRRPPAAAAARDRRAGRRDRGRPRRGGRAARVGTGLARGHRAGGTRRRGRRLCDPDDAHQCWTGASVTDSPIAAKPIRRGPQPCPTAALRVVALGGIGEVGRNMTVFEYDGRLLIVDCGVLFPEDQQPGVDLILPDFRAIEDRLDDIDALVLTHGHEDHIGAVPFLLRLRPDLPVVGSRFTLALLAAKCREHRLTPQLVQVVEGERRAVRAVRPASSSRSTTPSRTRSPSPSAPPPGWCCTPATSSSTSCRWTAGSPTSPGSPGSATRAWTCSCVDSTNAEVPGFVVPEREIGPVLDQVIGAATQRVIVACFASHVHRVQQVLDVGAAQRPPGRARRPVHGAQHGHRRRSRPAHGARRPARRPRRGDATCRSARCCSSPRGRRASRCRRCRGWRAASTGRSASATATRWCWPAR